MKLKLTVVSFLSIVGLAGALFTFAPSASAGLFEDAKKDACGGAQLEGAASTQCINGNTNQLDNTVQKIIDILSVVIGIVAVIMIIINGFKFITSGGDSNKVSSAKNGIIWAIVGLAIVALAQFIVKFVLSKV